MSNQVLINQFRTRIEEGEVEVPVLPEVASKVLQIVSDPQSGVDDLSRVIQNDQSMAAHILRIANSPAYSVAANVASLQQAISRLGMQTMAEVAIAASVNSRMFEAPGYEKHIHDIWAESLYTGLWAKEVARQLKRNVEAAFLCGLLHNIGRPMLQHWLAQSHPDLDQSDALEIEDKLSTQATAAVVKHWRMPSAVVAGVCHFEGDIATLPEQGKLVRAGKLMTQWMLSEGGQELFDIEAHAEALSVLALYPDDVQALKEKADSVRQSKEVMQP